MSVNTFDKAQSQYERKMARQKQLDMMEAAASGQMSPEADSSSSTPTSSFSSHSNQDGGVGSARRFLWDADEEEYKNVPSRAFAGGAEDEQAVNLMGQPQRPPGGIAIPRFSATTGMEGDHSSNIAPRSNQSAWHNDATPSADAEEYLEDARFQRERRGGVVSSIGGCCLATFHTIVGVFALLVECLTGRCRCTKKSFLMLGMLVAILVFAFSITAIVKRTNNGDEGDTTAPAPELDASIQDPLRFNAIRQVILDSGFSNADQTDGEETAQNLAIRWLTDDDPANLEPDHDGMLQRYAMATFFFSTYVSTEYQEEQNSDPETNETNLDFEWNYMDHWMTDKGICMWFGVECAPHLYEGVEETVYNSNNDILHLNLTDNNIQGTLPSEIAALENLISLDLGRNRLTGKIPTSLTNMEFLSELYLEENSFSGTLPTEFGSMKGMTEFFVGTNRLTGTLPTELNQLTGLRALGLDENFFTGTIPFLWDMKELLILYLDSNQLTGTIHWEIKHLAKVVDLRLRKNFLTGTIPFEMDDLVHLELLYFDDNQLNGTIPEMFASLPRLQEIQLYKNQFTGTLPVSIGTLDDLKVLYVDNNEFTGSIPEEYGDLRDVHTMFLFNNVLNGTIPTTIGNMEDLKDLQIYNNRLDGTIPSEIGNCFQLEKIELQDNEFTGIIPLELGNLEKLSLLKVYRNSFEGSMPEEVCALKETFDLGFVAADCNMDSGGTLECTCCNTCYP